MIRRRVVRVPASSANLGPGFDCMAAAVTLHMELEVDETGTFAVESELPIARGRENLCVRGFERLHPADGLTFRIRSEIPLSGGLGSSAAAIVAGLLAADHMFELDADLLALATELEGHPDNVAAALLGGFVVCADGQAARFEPPTGLEALAVVPEEAVRTRAARAALPGRGADAGCGVQRRPRRHAHARAGSRRLGPARARAGGSPASAAPGRPVPALVRARDARPLARRARGNDLGRGSDGARVVLLRADRRRRRGAGGRGRGLGTVLRAPFEPQGAYVDEL